MKSKNLVGGVIILAVVALAITWKEFVPIETIVGPVSHVRDGDTIEIRGRPIRLDALNCAEIGSELGFQAKSEMQRLVSGRELVCHLDGGKTYDRETGRCYLDGEDIARTLIREGHCGRCDAFDPLFTYAFAQWQAGPFEGRFPAYCELY